MSQLILTVFAIVLTAATLVSTLNYLPWWQRGAADVNEVLRASLPRLDAAYKEAARQNAGVPPAVTADSDGGFVANFQDLLGVLPAAPQTFTWSYHQHPNDGSVWANLHYVCLTSNEQSERDAWAGARAARPVFSSQQYIVSSTCGSTVSDPEPAAYPAQLAITFFVTYVPGVD